MQLVQYFFICNGLGSSGIMPCRNNSPCPPVIFIIVRASKTFAIGNWIGKGFSDTKVRSPVLPHTVDELIRCRNPTLWERYAPMQKLALGNSAPGGGAGLFVPRPGLAILGEGGAVPQVRSVILLNVIKQLGGQATTTVVGMSFDITDLSTWTPGYCRQPVVRAMKFSPGPHHRHPVLVVSTTMPVSTELQVVRAVSVWWWRILHHMKGGGFSLLWGRGATLGHILPRPRSHMPVMNTIAIAGEREGLHAAGMVEHLRTVIIY